jgi:iron complex outermembrane receptor protein
MCVSAVDAVELAEIKAIQKQLISLSLTELSDIEITSVAKKMQKVSESAAAISVITQEDIRRSAATNLPEVLRIATGIQVGQVNGHTWSIGARGFNDVYAAKILVLIDGRSVYMPDFAGVMWDMQDMVLEDIERIEVIRGPGGTMWGGNAVNGVINIITKHSKDTVGTLISAGAGTVDKAFGSLRHGVKLNEQTYMRVYAKELHQNAFEPTQAVQEKLFFVVPPKNNGDADDAWWSRRAGMRLDTKTDAATRWMFQAESSTLEKSNYGFFTRDANTQVAHGGHILGRLKHKPSEDSDLFVQAYYDYSQRDFNLIAVRNDTFDLDFHHRWQFSPQHEITWGGGYRVMMENSDSKNTQPFQQLPSFNYLPPYLRSKVLNLFLQDEIKLRPDLKLTLGNKLERNDATRWENQPSARIMWTATPQHSFWSAVSRSVRTPSRTERDLAMLYTLNTPYFLTPEMSVPIVLPVSGASNIRSEKQLSYELGWRFQPNKQLSFDTATFFNHYDDLISVGYGEPTFNPAMPALIAPLVFKNIASADTAGIELKMDWQVSAQWRLHAGYSYVHSNATAFKNSSLMPGNSVNFMMGWNAPHQINVRSLWNFAPNWKWDVNVRWRSRININPDETRPTANALNAYLALDTRLSWQMNKQLELSLVGKNLLSKQHLDFLTMRGADLLSTEVPRSAYLQMRWEF